MKDLFLEIFNKRHDFLIRNEYYECTILNYDIHYIPSLNKTEVRKIGSWHTSTYCTGFDKEFIEKELTELIVNDYVNVQSQYKDYEKDIINYLNIKEII
jgi:hypothetical protein